MPFDRTEHEPEEYDPEAEFRDPDSDSVTIPEISTDGTESSVSIPEVSVPEATTGTDELDVSSDLLTHFWALVLVLNGAILAVSLAALFAIFDGSTTRSGGLFVTGLVLFGFAYRRYRAYEAMTSEAHAETETATETEPITETETTPGTPTDSAATSQPAGVSDTSHPDRTRSESDAET